MKRLHWRWYVGLGIAALAVAVIVTIVLLALNNSRAPEAAPLSATAEERLKSERVLVIAVTSEQSPLVMKGTTTLDGFIPDYLQKLGWTLGVPVDVQLMDTNTALTRLATGQVFAVADVPVAPQIGADLEFSQVILEDATELYVPNGRMTEFRQLSDLDGKRVAVLANSDAQALLAPRERVFLLSVPDTATGLQMMLDGQADAYLGQNLETLFFLQSWPERNDVRVIGQALDRRRYALAVHAGDPDALEIVNFAIRSMRNSRLDEQVQRRWFGATVVTSGADALQGTAQAAGWGLFFGLIVLGAGGWAVNGNRRMLKEQVAERTRELEESRENYRLLIEHANDAILLIDPYTGDVREANRCAETMFGYRRDQLLQRGLRGLLSQVELNKTLAALQQAVSRGSSTLDKVACTSGGGKTLLVEMNVSMSVPAPGSAEPHERPVVQAIARDITERVRIEEQLMLQNRYLLALNKLTEALAPLQEPGPILRAATQVLSELFQVEAAGLLLVGGSRAAPATFLVAGRSNWLHRELNSFMMQASSQDIVRRSNTPVIYRADLLEPNAAAKWSALAPFTLIGVSFGPAGQRNGVVNFLSRANANFSEEDRRLLTALSQQLTTALEKGFLFRDLESAVDDLGASQRFSEGILNNITNGLITVDLSSTITSANRAAEQMLGFDERGLLHRPLSVVARPSAEARDGESPMTDLVRETLTDGRTYSREEFTFRTQGDRVLPVGATISPLRNQNHDVMGAILVFADMSEIKRLEEERRQMDHWAMLGQMSATMAHEIRNPLAAISAGIQFLAPRLKAEPGVAQNVDMILHDSDRLNRIIEDILAVSRHAPLNLALTSMPYMMNMLVDRWSDLELRQNHEIIRDVPEDLPFIKVDPARLERAMDNLARNAFEAILDDPNGKLWVTARCETGLNGKGAREYIVIELANTGNPIPPETAAKMFEPFFTTKAKGTGLGLAIAHRTIQEHSGTITYSSAPPRAVIFTIRIPTDL